MYLNEIPPIDEVLQSLLQQISDKSTSPDLRDRGYIYWRLLFQSPEKASEVVFNDIPPIQIEEDEDDQELLMNLIRKGGSVSSHLGYLLSSIFTKKVSAINRGEVEVDSEYISTTQKKVASNENQETEAADDMDEDILGGTTEIQENVGQADDFDILGMEGSSNNQDQVSNTNPQPPADDGFDILGMGTGINTAAPTPANDEEDLFGDNDTFGASEASFVNMPEESLVKKDTKGKSGNSGISIKGGFKKSNRMDSNLILSLKIKNKSAAQL
jgi:hypothetical protein